MIRNRTNIDKKDTLVVPERIPMQVKMTKEQLLHLIKVKNVRTRNQETEG